MHPEGRNSPAAAGLSRDNPGLTPQNGEMQSAFRHFGESAAPRGSQSRFGRGALFT